MLLDRKRSSNAEGDRTTAPNRCARPTDTKHERQLRLEREPREAPRESGKRLASCPRRGGYGKPDAELRVALDTFEGRPFVAVRLWERGRMGDAFFPTPKGVSVRPGELRAVIKALTAAARELGIDLEELHRGP